MASHSVKSRPEAEALLRSMAADDKAFRKDLIANPHRAIGKAVGMDLPANLKVTVLEEDAQQIYLVLPAAASIPGELSDDELGAVSGGIGAQDTRFNKGRKHDLQGAIIPPFNPGGFNPSGGG